MKHRRTKHLPQGWSDFGPVSRITKYKKARKPRIPQPQRSISLRVRRRALLRCSERCGAWDRARSSRSDEVFIQDLERHS
jgi:hypothetical protein